MSEGNSPAPLPDFDLRTATCVSCNSPIYAGAELCNECGSLQDWRRKILVWRDIFAAVPVFVAVAAGAYSLYNLRPAADLSVSSLECQRTTLTFLLTNTGTRAGIVSNAYALVNGEPKFQIKFLREEKAAASSKSSLDVSYFIRKDDLQWVTASYFDRATPDTEPNWVVTDRAARCSVRAEFDEGGWYSSSFTGDCECPYAYH